MEYFKYYLSEVIGVIDKSSKILEQEFDGLIDVIIDSDNDMSINEKYNHVIMEDNIIEANQSSVVEN